MISYVECLSGEGAGPGVTSHCWNGGPDEEQDELLPRKMTVLQPKTEGSLRRRLLSAKIHQQHDAILGLNGGGSRPSSPLGDRKPLPSHLQYLGNGPWHLPPRPHVHPSLTPESHGKLFFAPDPYVKSHPQCPPIQMQHSSCPLRTRHPTSSYPPGKEPLSGSALPVTSPLSIINPPKEPEVPPQYRYQPTRRRKTSFFCLRRRRGRSSWQEALQTTPLLHKGNTLQFL